jgi:hydrogenase maturation protease
MENYSSEPIFIIGIGNPDRGDDGIGLLTAERLRHRTPHGVQVVQHSGEGTGLIELWRESGAATIYIVDATYSGLPAGSVQYFEAHKEPLPAYFSRNTSTHAFGLAEAVELARALGCLPRKLVIYGIEGQGFDPCAPISIEVEAAASQVVERILDEVIDLTERNVSISPDAITSGY